MARIPQYFIEQLLERTDIVSLIDARVSLKKAGREYTACCPFHEEKTPSFTVSPIKQFYHCFGCGAHGTAISFLMEYDRLEFRDAVDVLAGNVGMTVPEEAGETDTGRSNREPLLAAMRLADRHFQTALRGNATVIDYLKNRGVSGEIAKQYGLGFAADAWDDLARCMPDKQAASQAGLLIERDSGGYFDRFRNRLMFPIRDTRGRTIAFGGRTLGDDKAKYLNSPETPLFHKSDHMYGLHEARQAQRHLDHLLVVEGYMDVIALAQHGFTNTVATLGTATTASHLTTLFRHTEEVIFCFDGDDAGLRAARKAMEVSLSVLRGARRIRFLFLPEGEDPDSLVRQDNGDQTLRDAIRNAQPASKVLLNQLTENLNLDTAEGRTQLIERARGPVNALPPEAFRAELIAEISRLSGLPANDLRELLTKHRTSVNQPATNPQAGDESTHTQDPHSTRLPAATRGLRLLLANPELANQVQSTQKLRENGNPGVQIMAEAIEFFTSNPTLSVAQWLERYRDHRYFDRLQELAADPVPGNHEQQTTEFVEVISYLQRQGHSRLDLRQRYNTLLAKQARAPLDATDANELKEILIQLQNSAKP